MPPKAKKLPDNQIADLVAWVKMGAPDHRTGSLAQQNFGLQGGITPDTSKLYEIGFSFPGKVVFDLWVDDIRFY